MRVSRLRPFLACAALTAVLASAPSCSRGPTEPRPRATVHRTVTVVVRDSLGVPAAGAGVQWTAQFDSAGLAQTLFASTDADGECMVVLAEGGWIVAAADGPLVAGERFVVAGPERALADTQAVRVVLHTGSRVTGTTTLAGRTEHSGTVVSGDTGGLAVTDADGAWALDGLPLGRWSLTMYHFGFAQGVAEVTITTPGSSVVAPAVSLISAPGP